MFTIRTATIDDTSEITRVVNAAFQVERHMRVPGRERTSEQNIRELMREVTFFVAEQNGRIVGAVLARVNGATGYFGMLSAAEELRGSGIGRALRERAEQFCKEHGCTEMTLTTGAFRHELLPYYHRAGYSIVRVEPGPAEWEFNQPFEVVHMTKRL
jgi:predicted N-acetyltransferase YhbS